MDRGLLAIHNATHVGELWSLVYCSITQNVVLRTLEKEWGITRL